MRKRSALVIDCPLCGKGDSHDTIKTYPHNIFDNLPDIQGNKLSPAFPWPTYRVREKWCAHCSNSFTSIEMPQVYLDALLKEVDRVKELERLVEERTLRIEKLSTKLHAIGEILTY